MRYHKLRLRAGPQLAASSGAPGGPPPPFSSTSVRPARLYKTGLQLLSSCAMRLPKSDAFASPVLLNELDPGLKCVSEFCSRGQCGSLLFHCEGLSPSTPFRSPLRKLGSFWCAPKARVTSGGRIPPRKLSIDLVADERLGPATGRAEGS